VLAVAYGALLVHGSLVPYDFSLQAPGLGTSRVLWLPVARTSVPDVVGNIALYLPLGLLLRAAFGLGGRNGLVALVASLATAGLISFGVEWLQTWLVSRVASFADFSCNVLGAAIGAALCRPESALARRAMISAADQWPSRRRELLAVGWGFLIVLASWAPFDFTFDVGLISQALKEATFVPLAAHARLAEQTHWAWSEPFSQANRALVAMWHLRLSYVLDVGLFAVLGVLVGRAQRVHRGVSAGATALSLAKVVAFAMFVTLGGLFVVTVGLDATRVLTRSAGAVLGVVLGLVAGRVSDWDETGGGVGVAAGRGLRRWAAVGVVCSVVYIAAGQLVPFAFVVSPDGPALDRIEWLPFHAYVLERIPTAAFDLLHKSFRYLFLGGCYAAAFGGGRLQRRRAYVQAGFMAVAVVGGTEFAQLWLPGRVCALTDVLVATMMTLGGVWLGARVIAFTRRAGGGAAADAASAARAARASGQAAMAAAASARSDAALLNAPIPAPGPNAPAEQVPDERESTRTGDPAKETEASSAETETARAETETATEGVNGCEGRAD